MLISLTNRLQPVTQKTSNITLKFLTLLSCIKNTFIINNQKFSITGLCVHNTARCMTTNLTSVYGSVGLLR